MPLLSHTPGSAANQDHHGEVKTLSFLLFSLLQITNITITARRSCATSLVVVVVGGAGVRQVVVRADSKHSGVQWL